MQHRGCHADVHALYSSAPQRNHLRRRSLDGFFCEISTSCVQELVLSAIKGCCSGETRNEVLRPQASPSEALLEGFAACNPFTAAGIAACGHSLLELLTQPEPELLRLLTSVPGVTEKSARLFIAQATAGTPAIALVGEAA